MGEVVWHGTDYMDGFIQHFGCFFTHVGYGAYGTADELPLRFAYVSSFANAVSQRPQASCSFSIIKKFGEEVRIRSDDQASVD